MTSQGSTKRSGQTVSTFLTQQAAETAEQALQAAGFSSEQITLTTQAIDPNPTIHESKARVSAGAGAVAGTLFGAIVGLLISVLGRDFPGLTPASFNQPSGFFLGVMLLTSGFGAAAGALLGGLSGVNAPKAGSDRERLSHKYLLAVQGSDSDILRAEGILRQQDGQT